MDSLDTIIRSELKFLAKKEKRINKSKLDWNTKQTRITEEKL